MATIQQEMFVEAGLDQVWDALRDFNAVHQRLAPGFVTDCRAEEGARVVTFANGMVARERFVGLDEQTHRLSYSIVGGQLTHHNASAQLFAEGAQRTRFVWITDVLPHEMAAVIGSMMEQGAAAMKRTLEGEKELPSFDGF
ncbi:SRPBCC family protein [Hydrogenophaga sp.]|uniref:SRPBCC family protein n=1 Tax=Hydrogenophaga sp. TaxID=1904254 RepID=UPI002FC5EA73